MITGLIIGIVIVLGVVVVAFINQPAFGRLPQGERLEKIEHSPHYKNGEFQNIHPTTLMTSDKGRLRSMWDFLISRPDGLNPDVPVPAIKSDLKNLADDSNVMVWFGHSSYLLQLSGKRILVDPVFCMASPVSFVNKPFKGTDIYKPEDMPDIDYLVISHDHWDHLDYQTVIRLKDRIRKVICPLGVGEHFEYWGFDKGNIIELDWYESALPDENFTVRCLPTRHFSGRGLTSNKTLWASFLLEAPSYKVYMGGDSGYDTHFEEIGKQYPDIDLAILENGQYNEGWRNIHTMPQYLGQAAKDLKARKVVTVHHSKYALARHRWDEPLKNEIEMAKENSLELIVPVIGQVMNLDNK
ncbi:MBL fold metallo-hydrolase [Parabacteroides faecis]|nr:MBL fold metallo-hydrolase [Parabacteroides faecis]RHS01032.1 MBL fold metallo-hydrolase [Parabacteroides sp. AF14-59]